MGELTKDTRANRIKLLLAAGTAAVVALAGCGVKKPEEVEPGSIPPNPAATSTENSGRAGGLEAEPQSAAEKFATEASKFQDLAPPVCGDISGERQPNGEVRITFGVTNPDEVQNPLLVLNMEYSQQNSTQITYLAHNPVATFTIPQDIASSVGENNSIVRASAYSLPEEYKLPTDQPLDMSEIDAITQYVEGARGIDAPVDMADPQNQEAVNAFSSALVGHSIDCRIAEGW